MVKRGHQGGSYADTTGILRKKGTEVRPREDTEMIRPRRAASEETNPIDIGLQLLPSRTVRKQICCASPPAWARCYGNPSKLTGKASLESRPFKQVIIQGRVRAMGTSWRRAFQAQRRADALSSQSTWRNVKSSSRIQLNILPHCQGIAEGMSTVFHAVPSLRIHEKNSIQVLLSRETSLS